MLATFFDSSPLIHSQTFNVQIMEIMVNSGGHFGSHNKQTMRRKDQNSIFFAFQFQFDRHFKQNFRIFAQKKANRLMNITSHTAAR